jgi:hypothetical protein
MECTTCVPEHTQRDASSMPWLYSLSWALLDCMAVVHAPGNRATAVTSSDPPTPRCPTPPPAAICEAVLTDPCNANLAPKRTS